MFRPGLLPLAVLVLTLTPQSGSAQFGGRGQPPNEIEPWTVKADMGEGKSVTGTLRLASVEIVCDLGRYELKPGKVKEIRFNAGEPRVANDSPNFVQQLPGTLVTARGEEIRGTIHTMPWRLETDLGELTLDMSKIRSITFIAKVE